MKYGVNRQVLLITAGIVWIVAGANILRIGIVTWLNDSQYWLFKDRRSHSCFPALFCPCLPKALLQTHSPD